MFTDLQQVITFVTEGELDRTAIEGQQLQQDLYEYYARRLRMTLEDKVVNATEAYIDAMYKDPRINTVTKLQVAYYVNNYNKKVED